MNYSILHLPSSAHGRGLPKLLALLLLSFVLLAITGCESEGGSASVSGSMTYGAGYYDPWYYGSYRYPPPVIATPPPRPAHPIARPR